MIRRALIAAALMLAAPAAAQSITQAELQQRYNRALAAGYKALFLCGAIANAERHGATRTADSVHRWELTGIQSPLDGLVREMPYDIVRRPDETVQLAAVRWAQDMPPRIATAGPNGCTILPIGSRAPSLSADRVVSPRLWSPAEREKTGFQDVPAAGQGQSGPFDAVFSDAFSGGYGAHTRTTAVLVRRHGETDGWKESSAYRDGFSADTPQRTWSVAKSIAATLVGAAVQRGEVTPAQETGFAQWQGDARRAITIDDLLRMASGRYSDRPGNRTDPLYFGGSSVADTAVAWPMLHEPGTVYRYANNDTLMAVKAIEQGFAEHSPAAFFASIGMDHTVAETDARGAYVLSSQVWTTASDLARLGELYLNDGVWGGQRILPADWREYVSAPSGPQPEGPLGYGAGFWLFNKSDGIPPDTIAAMGNRGQYVVIVPSRDIVIVRRGEDPLGSRFDIIAFTRDVLAALPA